MAKKNPKYPRTLYKSPGTQVLVSKRVRYTYDSLIVNNETEQDAAEEMGYIDSFHDAIFPPEKPKAKKVEDGLQEGF
jgi:hypothetical protein